MRSQPAVVVENEISPFLAEVKKLDDWLQSQQFHIAYDIVLRIRKKLKSPAYHDDVIAINNALTTNNINTLTTRANITYGAACPEQKNLGIAMMALGVSLLILSMLVITTVIACAFPLAGVLLLLGGTACFTAGVGFFRAGRQHGLARQLDDLAQLIRKDSAIISAA